MKKILLLLLLCYQHQLFAQLIIHDEHITNQQERMVFKSWDEDKFTPTPGFLYLNPQYWLTWALHPNYPKTDLRPLSPSGPQTQRIGLVLAMQQSDESYKTHSDTLSNVALEKSAGYLSSFSDADPLWLLYYQSALSALSKREDLSEITSLNANARDFLVSSGIYKWYSEEMARLSERLNLARTNNMERGSRILLYHRLLLDYRKAQDLWVARKRNAASQLSLKKTSTELHTASPAATKRPRSDIEIADEILKNSKL